MNEQGITDVSELKKSPMFNLSLSSKELFHSNLLAWIAEDEDTSNLFVSILQLFGLDSDTAIEYAEGIRRGTYVIKREYNNFDFCICENVESRKSSFEDKDDETKLVRIVLVLENKFKSIPYERQLKEYQEKVLKLNKDNNKCYFVLLSLSENICGLNNHLRNTDLVISRNGQNNQIWKFISYKKYAKQIVDNVKPQDSYKEAVLFDYAHYIEVFCQYLEETLPSDISSEKWTAIICSRSELINIRMDDIWQKLVVNIIASHLCDKSNWDCVFGNNAEDLIADPKLEHKVHVGTGFSRGTGLIEVKIKITDNCLFGIQIQDGYYKRLLETSLKNDKPRTTFDSILNKIDGMFSYSTKNWENPEDSNIFEPDAQIYPIRQRKGKFPDGFGGYGNTFICQSKKLSSGCSVEEVLCAVIKDINKSASIFISNGYCSIMKS